MMRRSILLAAALLVWSGMAEAQTALPTALPTGLQTGIRAPSVAAGSRVALVVGIGTYDQGGSSPTPAADARLMARALQAFGFTLVTGGAVIDAERTALDGAVAEFGRIAQGADAAIFYFSGHGRHAQGGNWLSAREGGPRFGPEGLAAGFVDLAQVLRGLDAAQARLSLVLLDAGLAEIRAPRGTIIALAGQPGSRWEEGPGEGIGAYTAALVEAMGVLGLGLMQMLNEASLRTIGRTGGRQEPWLATSPLRGDLILAARDGALPPDVPRAAPAAAHTPDFTLVNLAGRPVRELRAWLVGEAEGRQDRLGGNVLQAGERFRLTFPRDHGCHIDVRAGFGQGEEPGEIRNLDTCSVDMLVLTPQGRLVPADPDVRLVNETRQAIRRVEAALSSDREWGTERLDGALLPPGGTLELHLPQGVTCDIDIRVGFVDGTRREWRRVDTCALAQLPLH